MKSTNVKSNPIWLTPEEAALDFDVLVEHLRAELSYTRGKLRDVASLFPNWRERVECADGGLTCVISALYPGMLEYQKFKARSEAKVREAESVP